MNALKKMASRARQRSEEIILNAEKTEFGPDVEQLLSKTDKTEEQMKNLLHAIEVHLQPNPTIRALDPRKDKSGRQTTLDHLGEAMKETAKVVGPESSFGVVLLKAAHTEAKMGEAERQMISATSTQTLAGIRHILENDIKHIQKERAVLQKKRLELDTTKARWKRAGSPAAQSTLEPELRTAQADFNQHLDSLRTLLESLQSAVDQQRAHLLALCEAQLQYHAKCQQLLVELKTEVGA